ncbi:MAG: hypothetical protein QY321_02645 [Patescibacteria group bacterium]|nr:MAG: hypothetical protein QY321_02645 [Patescibacteria group bacterium]
MKKLTLLFFAFLMILFFAPRSEAQELKSSTYLPEIGMYEYVLELAVPKRYKTPYAASDLQPKPDGSGWEEILIYDSDGNGLYEFKFRSYNRIIAMYWSDIKRADANLPMQKSPYFNIDTKCVHFAVFDGKMVSVSEFNPTPPGKYGDEYVRWDDYNADWEVPIWVNNTPIYGEDFQYHFVMHSTNSWKHQHQVFTDASGWGKILVDPEQNDYDQPDYIGLGYGALLRSGDIVWPALRVEKVQYWNTKKDGFMIPVPD